MTTTPDDALHDALRRADLGWLSTHLDARLCPVAALGRLIRHEDAAVRYFGLVLLTERPADEGEAVELAALLPQSATDSAEAALLLARLHERLWPYLAPSRRPVRHTVMPQLPLTVRIAWLHAELLHEPAALRGEQPGELLYQAVRDLALTDARRPDQLVAELADSADPVLHTVALRLLREGLHAGLLAPALVRTHLLRLALHHNTDTDSTVATAALSELAEPWAALTPLPMGRLAAFLTADAVAAEPDAADAALAVAARHGHGGVLWQTAGDPALPPALRRRAVELLGDLADRTDITALTDLALTDPLLLGGPALHCLRGLHRRGHFPQDSAVPSVLALALADHVIPAREVATVLFTCRQAVLDVLTDAAVQAGAADWPRRLDLLVALAGQGAAELPIGEAITRLLPTAPRPEPFLAALRALRHTAAEAAVLALLPAAPAAALATLEAIGGRPTVSALRTALGLGADGDLDGGAGVVAPWLRAVRDRALMLLWQLTEDPAERRALLARLDPAELPDRIAVLLGGPDEQELALLNSRPSPGDSLLALEARAARGGAGTLPAVTELLRQLVAAAAADPAATPEPAVPQQALDALHALGRRLYERGSIRPSCLLGAPDADAAGRALVATLALDLLESPGLSAAEQAVLLELLLRAPWPGTRARVHRLLRHRDPQVRKHAIALLARDATGEDAQALSASLITLTTAADVQTVRQALIALGHARADWAGAAIADCLDHPTMNIKKTAAEALVRAGTPQAVPQLLRWLGRHDNPGLRGSLTEALRAVLGDAYPATLLAAAEAAAAAEAEAAAGTEHSSDRRELELLLLALDGTLSARAVLALEAQASPVVPALLALLAAGRIGLAAGTVEQLAPALARHGLPAPAASRPSPAAAADHDVRSLLAEGWNPLVALRIAERGQPPRPDRLAELRPLLAQFLALARSATERSARSRVLRLALLACPAPWTPEELASYARATFLLLDALADAPDVHTLLEAVAPLLSAVERMAVVTAVRALPPAAAPAGDVRTLALLRRCGAVLVRADLDQALAAARLGADPWRAEAAVLRDAFALPAEPAAEPAAEPDSRTRLSALIDAYPSAPTEARDALLDRMTDLQPLDAPPWTIAESARSTQTPDPRAVRADDLDQPRSAALRNRLLAMLRAPATERRQIAALALRDWPEPEVARHLLHAYLDGRVETLALHPVPLAPAELRADGFRPDRVALLAQRIDPWDRIPLVPLLLEYGEHEDAAVRAAAWQALRGIPGDELARCLADRLEAGAWGVLDLLGSRPLLRTPALERTRHRLRAEGRDDLADRLRLLDGPLRDPAAPAPSTAAPEPHLPPEPPRPATRQELLHQARTGSPEQIRRALTALAAPGTTPDAELSDLLGELLKHPRAGVRLHAHRTARAVLDRPSYLRHTAALLDDSQPSVVRSAVRTLCHAGWTPAIPAVAALLDHAHPAVRRAATEGLIALGAQAVPALRRAADHARPDRRSRYTDVLDALTQIN
ncbi:hypothetical protein P3T37_000839 [Kitasatospora sp. MAA4]|uniref:HEAT repeat domain-containing protein n=1 Tax=Kitasatospora sp. MAA4 TaxID=3035093 RepID=UPI0024741E16|nr:HEAT repeat domain-containing protein [Kitasatospora sp. MAA4]MDH6131470.1 hypothetical protein [Kitasatospora sp. MAA4]